MDKYNRRKFLSYSLKGAAGLAAISLVPVGVNKIFNNNEMMNGNDSSGVPFSGGTPLPVPPLLKNMSSIPSKAEFQLSAQIAKTEFIEGKETDTYGYNGNYLGPVIRVRKGDEVSIKVKNNLNEETTVHWHGLEVDGKNDGGPHSRIRPGETWNPKFTVTQPASTLWFHPHLLHKTGEQVYKGLAGLFYVDDDVSDNLNLPNEYGVNDIPLVIQDKKLDANGRFEYRLGMHDVMMGLQGGTILVNGAVNPYLEVPRGKMRFRLLNGSNARIYELLFSNNQNFYQVASDGGLLEQPVEMTKLVLSPGERAEIIVDFSMFKDGDTVELTNQGTEFMKFMVTGKKQKDFNIPNQLAIIERIDSSKVVKTRKSIFQGMGSNVNINANKWIWTGWMNI